MTPGCRHHRAAAGFTLTELLVAVGIMAGMMVMVAMVFNTATRASGQAQITSSVYRELRQTLDCIRRDLEGIQTGIASPCMLGLARVDVLAYRDAEDQASGRSLESDSNRPDHDWHRADVLMLLTTGRFRPYLYQPPPAAVHEYDEGFEEIRHVIYAHANLGMLSSGGDWTQIRDLETGSGSTSAIPASQWHLARRVVGFPVGQLMGTGQHADWPLTGPRFTGEAAGNAPTDVFSRPYFRDPDGVGPQRSLSAQAPPPGQYRYRGDTLLFYYLRDMETDSIYRFDAASRDYFLLANDLAYNRRYWFHDPGNRGNWTRIEDGELTPDEPRDPAPVSTQFTGNNPQNLNQWMYTGGSSRVRLDPNPPHGQERRMASYFLPGCIDFRVEFTYDDPNELAVNRAVTGRPIFLVDHAFLTRQKIESVDFVDNEAVENNPAAADPNLASAAPDGKADVLPASRPIRWQSVPPGERWYWKGLSTGSTDYGTISGDLREYTDPHRWPRALRITLRIVDGRNRLSEPVVHTLVHVFK